MTPDDKDWTWVLDRPCPECGFDTTAHPAGTVAGLVRANATEWGALVPLGRERPDDETWSALEYACHVRDVFRIFAGRIRLMLSETDPLFPNWDQDATAVEDRYRDQDPSVVIAELAEAAEGLAALLESVSGDGWDRPGRRSNGSSFTVASIARYMVHDPIHHLWDVSGERRRPTGPIRR